MTRRAYGEGSPEDRFADLFACNLLMPEREVYRLIMKGFNELQLALYFDVPREAVDLWLRCLELKTSEREQSK